MGDRREAARAWIAVESWASWWQPARVSIKESAHRKYHLAASGNETSTAIEPDRVCEETPGTLVSAIATTGYKQYHAKQG